MGTQHSKKSSQNIEVCLVLVTSLPFRWMVPEWVPKTREDLNLFYESMTIQPDFQQCIVLCIILHTV